MYLTLRTIITAMRDEYRGWHKFRHATGIWPVCSITASIFSIPAVFMLCFPLMNSLMQTDRLPLICAALFGGIIFGAFLWYWLRRLACKIDVARAKHSSDNAPSAETLEMLIR